MTIAESSDVPVAALTEFTDLHHIMWIMRNIERPFAELEARLDKALQCTTFTGQMAAMEDSLNIDATRLPSAIRAKWEQLIVRIAETTVFGECAPPGR